MLVFKECRNLGGYLVSINTEEENEKLKEFLATQDGTISMHFSFLRNTSGYFPQILYLSVISLPSPLP